MCTGAGLALIVLSSLSSSSAASPIDPCRPLVVCAVKVEQLPAVLLSSGGYELIVSGHSATPLPSTGIAHVAISGPSVVRLAGAAYQGSVSLDPAGCGGDAVAVIEATPKPARLEFQSGGVPLSELVVSCVRGCPHERRMAAEFPEISFPCDATELIVELEFKALGYRSRRDEFKLNPGTNDIRVTLDRID